MGGMGEKTVQASTFKARCLALLDEVARTRTTVVVTKHGRPLARLVPLDEDRRSTRGTVTLLADDDEAFLSTDDTWHAATDRALREYDAGGGASRVEVIW